MLQLVEIQPHEIVGIVGPAGCLGSGAFGVVKLGFHKHYGTVAVKCISYHLNHAKKCYGMSKEEKEIAVLHMVSDPIQNAVKFYGFVQWFNCIGLVMEHMPYGNLYELVEKTEEVKLGALLRYRICCEIADGIFHIHNLTRQPGIDTKVVHGDIKAENVLLTYQLHCKIADFGSSKIANATGHTQSTFLQQNQTSTDFTPMYAPPEILKNHDIPRTPFADVYSFSMIVYLVLKRGYPCDHTVQSFYLQNVADGKPPDPTCDNSLVEECETDDDASKAVQILKTVLLQCQAVEPLDRPSMENVTKMLQDQLVLSLHHHKLQRQVEAALANVKPYEPLQEDHFCQTLDNFLPPSFQGLTTVDYNAANNSPGLESTVSSLAIMAATSTDVSSAAEAHCNSAHTEEAPCFSQVSSGHLSEVRLNKNENGIQDDGLKKNLIAHQPRLESKSSYDVRLNVGDTSFAKKRNPSADSHSLMGDHESAAYLCGLLCNTFCALCKKICCCCC